MSTTQVAQNGLDRGLGELETLGLTRPPNVLLTEYLNVLTAEDVLDAALAAQIAAAFNRVRYSAVPADDTQVNDAAASLDRAVARLAAMNPERRTEISERVRNRIYLLGGMRGSFVEPGSEGSPSIGSWKGPVTRAQP